MLFEQVGAFMEKYGLPYKVNYTDDIRLLTHEEFMFRYNFLLEEVEEFRKANETSDIPEAIDALIDIIYVALGTLHMMQLDDQEFANHFAIVHKANMSKVRVGSAGLSKRDSALDVVKPEGWKPPQHAEMIDAFKLFKKAISQSGTENN